MKKFLAAFLALAMIASLLPAALADGGLEPITLTVFRGDPGDQPDENNKIYKLIEEEFGIKFEFEFLAGDLDETLEPITLTVFRGDPGDQPAEDNKIYKLSIN